MGVGPGLDVQELLHFKRIPALVGHERLVEVGLTDEVVGHCRSLSVAPRVAEAQWLRGFLQDFILLP